LSFISNSSQNATQAIANIHTTPSLHRGNTFVMRLGSCDGLPGHHRAFDDHIYPLLTDLSVSLECGQSFQTAAFSF